MTHVTHSRISLLSGQVSGFTTKLLYVLLRTPRGPRLGFRESFSFRPSVRPQVKVLPPEF